MYMDKKVIFELIEKLKKENPVAKEAYELFNLAISSDDIVGIFLNGKRFIEEFYKKLFLEKTKESEAKFDLTYFQKLSFPSSFFPFYICYSHLLNNNKELALESLVGFQRYPWEKKRGKDEPVHPSPGVETGLQHLRYYILEDHINEAIESLERELGIYMDREMSVDALDKQTLEKEVDVLDKQALENEYAHLWEEEKKPITSEEEWYGEIRYHYPTMSFVELCEKFAKLQEYERAEQIVKEIMKASEPYYAVIALAKIAAYASLSGKKEYAEKIFKKGSELAKKLDRESLDVGAFLDFSEQFKKIKDEVLIKTMADEKFKMILNAFGNKELINILFYDDAFWQSAPSILSVIEKEKIKNSFEKLNLITKKEKRFCLKLLTVWEIFNSDNLDFIERLSDISILEKTLNEMTKELLKAREKQKLLILLPFSLFKADVFGNIILNLIPLYDIRSSWKKLLETEKSFRGNISNIISANT